MLRSTSRPIAEERERIRRHPAQQARAQSVLQQANRYLGRPVVLPVEMIVEPWQRDHRLVHVKEDLAAAVGFDRVLVDLWAGIRNGDKIKEIFVDSLIADPGDKPEPGAKQDAAQKDRGITPPSLARIDRRCPVSGRRRRSPTVLPGLFHGDQNFILEAGSYFEARRRANRRRVEIQRALGRGLVDGYELVVRRAMT